MSDPKDRPLPPELRARLEQEPPTDRDELERVWNLLGQAALPAGPPETDAAWKGLIARLDAEASKRPPRSAAHTVRRPRRRTARWRRWAVAAAVTVGIAVGALLWRQPVRVSAPPGTSTVVSLPDGSSVELSSGTVLSYRRGFDALPLVPAERRAVTLHGEAFFEVNKRPRPFIIETFNARIEVLGTRFNVRAWPEASVHETQVTLLSGRVQVAAPLFTGRSVTLTAPGQSAQVSGTAAPPTAPQDTSIQRVLAWRRQGFAVSAQPLPVILDRLERRYGVRLTLRDGAAAADSMTLFYAGRTDLETILHDICVANGLNYRPTSRGYTIFRKAPAAPPVMQKGKD